MKDVHEFIRNQFAAVEERKVKRAEKEAQREAKRKKRGLLP